MVKPKRTTTTKRSTSKVAKTKAATEFKKPITVAKQKEEITKEVKTRVVEPQNKVEPVKEFLVEKSNVNYSELLGDKHIKVLDSDEKKIVSKYPIKVILKNYFPDKQVKVKYTEDNWKTFNEEYMDFISQDENNIEEWNAYLKISARNKENFEYIISYDNNGEIIYDNNEGNNYKF